MGLSMKVKDYLESKQVSYQLLEHEPAFTAQEIADAQHLPGRIVIKTVIVCADGQFVMCVLPAVHRIDFGKLKDILGVSDVHLAEESEVSALFTDCEVGAEPPFGEAYGLKVYADKILEENEEIAFNAGTHTDMLRIKYRDFVRLVQPIVANFGVHVARTEEENWREAGGEEEDNAKT
ncbi:MAG: YbaK/EbsC family protein [Parachlamydiaceae bacterium]|nr:YbaK/EbsC family protein [Parachlamydiaceae bacterium]